MLFRDGEGHIDRVNLIDHHQSGAVIKPDQVSFVNQHAANPPIHRRIDVTITQLHLGVIDGGFVRIDYRFRGIGVGFNLIILLARDVLFLDQLGITPNLFPQVLEVCGFARLVCFRLFLCGLMGARVNRKMQLALFYVLPFLEMRLLENTGNLTLDGDRSVGFYIANRADLHGHAFLDCRSN
jgi:hypothetical protein